MSFMNFFRRHKTATATTALGLLGLGSFTVSNKLAEREIEQLQAGLTPRQAAVKIVQENLKDGGSRQLTEEQKDAIFSCYGNANSTERKNFTEKARQYGPPHGSQFASPICS